MSDTQRRETSLLLGMGIVVAIVAAVFFSMTMAWRQAAQRQARWRELRQQLALAQRQAQEIPAPSARERLAAQAQEVARGFLTVEQVPEVRERLAALAEQSGGALTWLPTTTPVKPASPLPGFDDCYDVLPLVATVEAPYRGIAQFLTRLNALDAPLVGVRSVTLTPPAIRSDARPRLKARLVLETYLWHPGAAPKGGASTAPTVPEPPLMPPDHPEAPWSRDPFDPRYAPGPEADGLTLSGILWDPIRPTCLINGMELGLGGTIRGATVVVITPDLVVLRGEAREVVLGVPP